MLCCLGIIYFSKFSEQAQQISYSESILAKDYKELIFAFQNYKLISIEINDLFHKKLKHNKMFTLTFKDLNTIKQFHLHELNITHFSKNIFYKNQNSNKNYETFLFYFSNLFSHYSYNKEKDIVDFMNIFVEQGIAKRNP